MRNITQIFTGLAVLLFTNFTVSHAQVITTDPSLFMVVGANGIEERSLWKEVQKKQTAITEAQAATTAVVDKLKEVQNKIYTGLVTVSSAVKDGYAVVEIGKEIDDIVMWEGKMIAESAQHPVAAAFAVKIQKSLIEKTTACITDVSQLILKAKDEKLQMTAGEREQLLFNIKQDLNRMDALAMTSYYTVHWVVMQGIINSINPFAGYVNIDKGLVSDVLHTWKN